MKSKLPHNCTHLTYGEGVRAARIPHPEQGHRPQPGADRDESVERRLYRRLQRGGRLYPHAAQEGGRGF